MEPRKQHNQNTEEINEVIEKINKLIEKHGLEEVKQLYRHFKYTTHYEPYKLICPVQKMNNRPTNDNRPIKRNDNR